MDLQALSTALNDSSTVRRSRSLVFRNLLDEDSPENFEEDQGVGHRPATVEESVELSSRALSSSSWICGTRHHPVVGRSPPNPQCYCYTDILEVAKT